MQQQVRFRGRKLLASTPPVPVQGMILELSHQGNGTTTTRKNHQLFDSIQEWHHEETLVEIGSSRVETAMGWFPIANAMHEELDVS